MTVTVQQIQEARQEALDALTTCAEWIRKRDQLIREARAVGVRGREIAAAIGMNRQHIYLILKDNGEHAET